MFAWDDTNLYGFDVRTLLTCICLTAGVNLLTPSGHRQICDITTGIDVWAQNAEGGGGPYIRRGAD